MGPTVRYIGVKNTHLQKKRISNLIAGRIKSILIEETYFMAPKECTADCGGRAN
jgi:hypothetical protein